MEDKSIKLQKKLIWNHIVLGTMNKDDEVLIKASKDFDDLLDKAREEGVREYIEPKLVEIEEKILLIEEHLRDTSQMPAEVLGDMKRNLSILNAEKGRLFIDLRKYS